jgi:hypothetical protein
MDGDIDDFMEEYLKFSWENKSFVPDGDDDL